MDTIEIMTSAELTEMLEGVRYQGYGVSQQALISILESHIEVSKKLARVSTCR